VGCGEEEREKREEGKLRERSEDARP